ncbi:caldesmon-like [Paramacrobiotus metropolitanus]|uniref:caldesmon-like n=1 Tax=Paramacrobiotus metropolitanus TaxID=2943436 RepID=UPI002445E474|nr:caldesmon-like [Paramacrobiotus metropolitanus]
MTKMAERGQPTRKGQDQKKDVPTGDPITNYNENCPHCKRNNAVGNERYPCWTCISKMPTFAQLVIQESKRGNLAVFRGAIRGNNWNRVPVEDRMILEDKYRSWVNKRAGWDATLEPPKCAETDAYRKGFKEETARMVQAQREEEKKRAEAKAAAGRAKASFIPVAVLKRQDGEEAAVLRQSLIQQIDIILADPVAISKNEYAVYLREKVSLTKGNPPSQVIKIAVEERIERMRQFRAQENEVTQAFRNFKRDEFKRSKSPERSRYESDLGRAADRDQRSRGHERSLDRSRERSRDFDRYDRDRGHVKDTRSAEQKRKDDERIRRERDEREKCRKEAKEKRIAEEYKKINDEISNQQSKGHAGSKSRDTQPRGLIPAPLIAQATKLGQPVANINCSETAKRQLRDYQIAMNNEQLKRQFELDFHRCAERIRQTMGTGFNQPADFVYDFIKEISVDKKSFRPELAMRMPSDGPGRRGRRNQRLNEEYQEAFQRNVDNPLSRRLEKQMEDARERIERVRRRRDRSGRNSAQKGHESEEESQEGELEEPRDWTSDRN